MKQNKLDQLEPNQDLDEKICELLSSLSFNFNGGIK